MAIPSIITSLITTLILIPLNGLLLMLSTKIFRITDQSYKTAIKVALIVGVGGFIFDIIGFLLPKYAFVTTLLSWVLVSILLVLWLIKTNYNLDWGKTLLVWLIWFIFYVVAFFIIVIVIASVVIGLVFGGAIKLPPT